MSGRWGELDDGRSWEAFKPPSGVRRFKIANKGGAMICAGYLNNNDRLQIDFGWSAVPDDLVDTLVEALRGL